MHMLHYGSYWSWITIEGQPRTVYDVRQSGNLITCWIASEVGKKFTVNWYDSNRDIPLKAQVYIDGTHCDTHVMLDSHNYPDKPNGVGISYTRTSGYTRRDFVFAPIQVTDDDSLLDYIDNTMDLGVIKLHLWRIQVLQVSKQVQRHEYGQPMLEGQVVHERSKKAGSHHVRFGQEYMSEAPIIDAVKVHELDTKPWLTFEFKYRPMDLLMANDIVPRSLLYALSPTPDLSTLPKEEEGSKKSASELRRLEDRVRARRAQGHIMHNNPNYLHNVKQECIEVIDLT